MNKKLTLSLDESVIQKAKIYAENTGNSLSGLVEDFFEKLADPEPRTPQSTRIKSIAGKINLPNDFDETEELRRALEEKHLK